MPAQYSPGVRGCLTTIVVNAQGEMNVSHFRPGRNSVSRDRHGFGTPLMTPAGPSFRRISTCGRKLFVKLAPRW